MWPRHPENKISPGHVDHDCFRIYEKGKERHYISTSATSWQQIYAIYQHVPQTLWLQTIVLDTHACTSHANIRLQSELGGGQGGGERP